MPFFTHLHHAVAMEFGNIFYRGAAKYWMEEYPEIFEYPSGKIDSEVTYGA